MNTESILKPPTSQALKSGKVTLSPGESIGEHVTDKREELIIIVKGNATISKEDEKIEVNEGNTHFIRENIKHNVTNNSDKNLEYIYVVSLFD